MTAATLRTNFPDSQKPLSVPKDSESMLGYNRVQIGGFLNRLVQAFGRVNYGVHMKAVTLPHDQFVELGDLTLVRTGDHLKNHEHHSSPAVFSAGKD